MPRVPMRVYCIIIKYRNGHADMKAEQAKLEFGLEVQSLKCHYDLCSHCAQSPEVCWMGAVMWKRVGKTFLTMLETCVLWHHDKFKGQARVSALTDKLLRSFKIMTSTGRASDRGVQTMHVKGVRPAGQPQRKGKGHAARH